jgi:tetratricopeptide (TPR) repeat protein
MLDAALAREPRHYGCLLARGQLHEERGDLAAAVRDWEAAAAADPTRTVARYNLGSHLGQLGRKDEAIAHMQQVARMRPDDGMIGYNAGTSIANNGRDDLAIEHFDRGRRLLGPQNAIQLNRADCLMKLERWQEALDELDSLIEREPDWCWATLRRAQCLAQLGREEESEAQLQRTMVSDELDLDTMRAYARDRNERGRHDESIAIRDQLDREGVAGASDYFARGGCRLDAEREPELALADYERAIALAGGDDPAAQVNAAVCLNRLGRHAEALPRTQRADVSANHPQQALRERIRALIGLDQPRALIEALAGFELDRSDVRRAAAAFLRERGFPREALAEFARLAQGEPDHGFHAWGLADCLKQLGRRDEAAAWFERAEQHYLAAHNERDATLCREARDDAKRPRNLLARLFGRG